MHTKLFLLLFTIIILITPPSFGYNNNAPIKDLTYCHKAISLRGSSVDNIDTLLMDFLNNRKTLSQDSEIDLYFRHLIEEQIKKEFEHQDRNVCDSKDITKANTNLASNSLIKVEVIDLTSEDIKAIEESEKKYFHINGKPVEDILVQFAMTEFFDNYKKKHFTEEYSDDVLEGFFELLKDASNIKQVLYFMALCSVESNFDQYVPTKYGVGISQVVYRIHKKYISELGVTKDQFYKDPKYNIYIGYNIFLCYLKSSKHNYTLAATKYNGNATKGYANKVNIRYNQLISKFM